MKKKVVMTGGVARVVSDMGAYEASFSLELLQMDMEIVDTTFGQFLNWVFADPENTKILGRIFDYPMGGASLQALLDEAKTPTSGSEISHLVVGWSSSDIEQFDIYPTFYGLNRDDPDIGEIGLGGRGIGGLLHLPMEIRDSLSIYGERLTMECDGPPMKLIDVIYGVLFELTWEIPDIPDNLDDDLVDFPGFEIPELNYLDTMVPQKELDECGAPDTASQTVLPRGVDESDLLRIRRKVADENRDY